MFRNTILTAALALACFAGFSATSAEARPYVAPVCPPPVACPPVVACPVPVVACPPVAVNRLKVYRHKKCFRPAHHRAHHRGHHGAARVRSFCR